MVFSKEGGVSEHPSGMWDGDWDLPRGWKENSPAWLCSTASDAAARKDVPESFGSTCSTSLLTADMSRVLFEEDPILNHPQERLGRRSCRGLSWLVVRWERQRDAGHGSTLCPCIVPAGDTRLVTAAPSPAVPQRSCRRRR